MNYSKYPRPFEVGKYRISHNFMAICEHVAIKSGNGGTIALCGPDDQEAQEFARLFSAAPDMLELLEKLLVMYDTRNMTPVNEYSPTWNAVRAAIAKAKGE